MAMAAAARSVLRETSVRRSLMVLSRAPLPPTPLPPTIPAFRVLTRRDYSSKMKKMPDVVEQLAKLLKEPPTEANWSKAQALFEELSAFYGTKEFVRQNTSATTEFSRRLYNFESVLSLNTNLIVVVASVFGAAMLTKKSNLNKVELRVDHLEQCTNKTDEFLVGVERKMYHHDECFKRMKPEYHCTCCKAATSTEARQEDSQPTAEPTPEDSSPDAEGFFSWSWTPMKKVLLGN